MCMLAILACWPGRDDDDGDDDGRWDSADSDMNSLLLSFRLAPSLGLEKRMNRNTYYSMWLWPANMLLYIFSLFFLSYFQTHMSVVLGHFKTTFSLGSFSYSPNMPHCSVLVCGVGSGLHPKVMMIFSGGRGQQHILGIWFLNGVCHFGAPL